MAATVAQCHVTVCGFGVLAVGEQPGVAQVLPMTADELREVAGRRAGRVGGAKAAVLAARGFGRLRRSPVARARGCDGGPEPAPPTRRLAAARCAGSARSACRSDGLPATGRRGAQHVLDGDAVLFDSQARTPEQRPGHDGHQQRSARRSGATEAASRHEQRDDADAHTTMVTTASTRPNAGRYTTSWKAMSPSFADGTPRMTDTTGIDAETRRRARHFPRRSSRSRTSASSSGSRASSTRPRST